jgi:hypothetical protein
MYVVKTLHVCTSAHVWHRSLTSDGPVRQPVYNFLHSVRARLFNGGRHVLMRLFVDCDDTSAELVR